MNVTGLMSGTSLDGLDLCFADFGENENGDFHYKIQAAETFPYPQDLKKRLSSAQELNAFDFILLHNEYGRYLGERVVEFLTKHKCKSDFVASHGHTVFHQPSKSLTFQIGSGAEIAAVTGLPVICDFRSLDVALGGQGAPLVPVGDELLFPDCDYCLNIGGFANISFRRNGKRVAYDICPANIVLNMYAEQRGKTFDAGGEMAASGALCRDLLDELNSLEYYSEQGPKSLGREWAEQHFIPVVERSGISVEDKLRTLCEHIAIQIASASGAGKMLVTGGGAFNSFLIQRISAHCRCCVTVPDDLTVNFKEALIFAFLGQLYLRNRAGCLSSVTGATVDNIGGAMYRR
ncbi:MAG: anhydro-N-acetylmuramic acid kinase [Prevotellaceae bacterium]|jgi:anhydro-N-acetylmuramic acid kinase|nr:anhydro-N-acetylmuramic acid kinase [Prevotellaceae bacterium]